MEFAKDVGARQMIMLQTLAKRQFQKINGDDEPMETPLGDGFTSYSGGALGTDSVAEFAARELGMNLEIKIPPDHARARTVTPLTPQDLDLANPYLERAANVLRRPFFPATGSYKNNLLRRNFHIVREAEAVYAFGQFETINKPKTLNKETKKTPMIYVYDAYHQAWFECVLFHDGEGPDHSFKRIYKKPYLMSQSAVVGSRDIVDKTGKEIVALFERTADRVMAHRTSMQLLTKQMEAFHISPLASHPNPCEAKTPSWANK